jgi:carbonic anhydrase
MEHIIDGVLRFQREVHPSRESVFHKLALGQKPAVMFIGCSDSRIVPELLTQQGPGELFVVRNAGNIVPPHSDQPGGVTASIEYAVAVLEIPDIVVCGHSGCGAMTAILRSKDELNSLPAVARWLRYADAARDAVAADHGHEPEAERLSALIFQNVLAQLENMRTHPVVAKAVEEGRLHLHGWVYDIGSGQVLVHDAAQGRFVPIESVQAHDEVHAQ